jgi:hypothetical protein
MDENIAYVHTHFISEGALTNRSGVSRDTVVRLIDSQLLPRPCYFRGDDGRLTSNLGSTTVELDSDYHHPSSTTLASHHAALLEAGADAKKLTTSLKDGFITAYIDHLHLLNDLDLVEAAAWTEKFSTRDMQQAVAETEFQHWLAGTYGLCTRHNNPQAVAVKECMVTSVDSLTGKGTQEISTKESERLTRYLKLYDQVAALFAPFERPTSSGYRLRVTIAMKYGVTL